MKYKFDKKKFSYNGEQLKHLFAYENYRIAGDSIVAWIGPCDIPFEHMVDSEDKIEQSKIQGDEMLHFIIEAFHPDIYFSVTLQRLFTSIVESQLRELKLKQSFERSGDDLYFGKKKLSISIASISIFSSMVHFAMNVKNTGTPVETISFAELKIDAPSFAEKVMKAFVAEYESIVFATTKVKSL